jgi:small-conductance mechanosensitive channel
MSPPEDPRPLRVLFRNLVLVVLLAAALYVIFVVGNRYLEHQFLGGLTGTQVLLLEAGAIVLLAYVVAKAFTSAVNAVLRRRGQLQHGATVRIFLNLFIGVGGVLALFTLAGVSVESIFLGSAFAGIILGLAAQTVLANVFAGLLLVLANPFHPGDRVSLISSSYGAFAPSYPHEMVYPSYSGVVEDVELLYTVLRLDSGGIGKVPNSVVIGALVLQPNPGVPKAHRVRMTFATNVPIAVIESALPDVRAAFPEEKGQLAPRLEVTDISATTWDGVFIIWSSTYDDGAVRDRVMRAVLSRLAPAKSSG